ERTTGPPGAAEPRPSASPSGREPDGGGDAVRSRAIEPYPSISSFRAAHTELLRRLREQGDGISALYEEVETFLVRGRATGQVLDTERDRWDCRSTLDYWSTLMFRAGRTPPDATLAEPNPELAPALDDKECPYLGLDAFREENHHLFFGRDRLVKEM